MNAAVFVDFENLYLSLKSRNDGLGVRTRELSLHILEGMLARLRKKGHPMVIGRSYAAFDTYPGVEVAHDLALMGLDPQYVLISHTGKNSADVQLALDVARVVFRRADIQLIVIVSGDRDFIPLARQVLEEGRELRIVAIPDTTSGDLRERVGEMRFVNALELVQSRLASLKSADAASKAEPPADVPDAPPEMVEQIAGELAHEMVEGMAAEMSAEVRDGMTAEMAGEIDGGIDGAIVKAPPRADNGRARRAAPVVAPPVKAEGADGSGPTIVGHIPVTWQTQRNVSPEEHEQRLQECLEMLVRTRLRHNSPDIWLSPFLKGPMSQHFSNLVHPERRSLINDLRNRGVIHVEERENAYADHPYSVIVIDERHPMAQAAWERATRGRS